MKGVRKFPHFLQNSKSSAQCSQGSATCSCLQLHESSPRLLHHFLRSVLSLSSSLPFYLENAFFSPDFPSKNLPTFRIFLSCYTPYQFLLTFLIIPMIFLSSTEQRNTSALTSNHYDLNKNTLTCVLDPSFLLQPFSSFIVHPNRRRGSIETLRKKREPPFSPTHFPTPYHHDIQPPSPPPPV